MNRKSKPIPMSEVIIWITSLTIIAMFAAIGMYVTFFEFYGR